MLRLHVVNENQDETLVHPGGPIEFGRIKRADGTARLVVNDQTASRDQLRLEELPDGTQVLAINLSASQPVTVDDGTELSCGEQRLLALPTALSFGLTLLEVEPAASQTVEKPDQEGYLTIAQPVRTAGPGALQRGSPLPKLGVIDSPARPAAPPALAAVWDDPASLGRPKPAKAGPKADMMGATVMGIAAVSEAAVGGHSSAGLENMARWLETVLALQRVSEIGPEFYTDIARVLVEMIGLDLGMVLLRTEDGAWSIAARHATNEQGSAQRFSRTVLNRVTAHRRTFYQDFAESQTVVSLQNAEAVVASPIFGVNDEVVGVLYGMRALNVRAMMLGIKPLQAQLVQLLAAAVGSALARTTAVRTRVQFEQFFSPELVRELERDPRLLEGRQQEVTILVSDLRGFTALSERLEARETIALIHDLMEALSNRIAEAGGVIVDYAGDGILAMWNAPLVQEDHALRAANAALAMQSEMPALNERWQARIGGTLNLGVGVNTGPCQVGNTGSRRKLKYGPHGYNVNLASRVQDATKKLGTPLVISGSTRSGLPASHLTRRLCRARLAGINAPVDLYELVGPVAAAPQWMAQRDAFEASLAAYEAANFAEAGRLIKAILNPTTTDKPTLALARRIRDALKAPPDGPFDGVLDLTAK